MTAHISARVAWHQEGWNGKVCQDHASNIYCNGRHSNPEEMIRESRDLEHEKSIAGKSYSKLGGNVPPYMYSINAFGETKMKAFADPPVFFKGEALTTAWELKSSTVASGPMRKCLATMSREQYEHILPTFSHSSYPAAPQLCLAAFDELKQIGLPGFTKKHDPYHDIPLNEDLPQPVINLPIPGQDNDDVEDNGEFKLIGAPKKKKKRAKNREQEYNV